MFQGLVTAFRTLTILRVPGRDARDFACSLPWFPLVGGVLGLLLWGIGMGFGLVSGGWPSGAAVIVVAGGVILTRGFHLDGLADWADGFGGGRDQGQTLAIMKDPHVGAFGVAAMILVLMTKWAACMRLMEAGALYWIMPAFIISRTAMVELAVLLPYARKEGGTAGPFVSGAHASHRISALGLALLLVFICSGLGGLVLFFVGWVMCRLLGVWFEKRVGGVTGDLLGACCELVETGVLVVCAAGSTALSPLIPHGIFPI